MTFVRPLRLAIAALTIGAALSPSKAQALSILIPNYSFEGPIVQPDNPTGVISSPS